MPRSKKTKADLEKEIERLNKIINGQQEQIHELLIDKENLKQGVDTELRKELKRAYEEIDRLKGVIEQQSKYIETLKNRKAPKHNERGAGRKPVTTKEDIEYILELRAQGLSYKKISDKTGFAVGTVYNVVKNIHKLKNE